MEGLNGVIGAVLSIFLLTGFCEGTLVQAPEDRLLDSQIFSAPGTSKVEIRNVTLDVLSKADLRQLNQDLTSLKIADSEIGEISRFAFDRLKHLNLLDLSNNDLKYIDPDTFSRLPGLEILVLKNLGLKSVDLNLKNVQELILSGNKIESIGGENIRGENINFIDLSSNNLRNLTESFEDMIKLSMLDLSRNQIDHIRNDFFVNNTNLLRILLSNNKMTSVNGLAFPWVKTLDLFENQIEYLLSSSFSEMGSLEDLVLAFNKIKFMEDPFRDLIELKFLNLAWNQIENIEPKLFRNNRYLTKLALQGNKLKSLSRFQNVLHHLSHLDLSHNELSTIDTDFFKSTPNLNYLDLSFNRLTTISSILKPLENLNVVLLAYNRIVFHGDEFSENSQLTHVNLSSNGLDLGLSTFRNHVALNSLDLSRNKIKNICDANVKLKNLLKIDLRENEIQNVLCFNEANFESLCEINVKNNPLLCGEKLDHFMWTLAVGGCSPVVSNEKIRSDVFFMQCQVMALDHSLKVWDAVKQELCPKGKHIYQLFHKYRTKVKQNNEKQSTEVISQIKIENRREFLNVNYDDKKVVEAESILLMNADHQSERKSWEDIEDNSGLLDALDNDGIDNEEETGESFLESFGWYLIVALVIFLGIGFCVTILRAGIYILFCLRLRNWGKSCSVSTKSYVVLSNEVYKRTTEPSASTVPWLNEQLHQSASERKNYFYNLIRGKSNKNSDYDKKILINP